MRMMTDYRRRRSWKASRRLAQARVGLEAAARDVDLSNREASDLPLSVADHTFAASRVAAAALEALERERGAGGAGA